MCVCVDIDVDVQRGGLYTVLNLNIFLIKGLDTNCSREKEREREPRNNKKSDPNEIN